MEPTPGTPKTNRTLYVNYISIQEKKRQCLRKGLKTVKYPLRAARAAPSTSVLSALLTPPLRLILRAAPPSHGLTPALSLCPGSPPAGPVTASSRLTSSISLKPAPTWASRWSVPRPANLTRQPTPALQTLTGSTGSLRPHYPRKHYEWGAWVAQMVKW